MDNKLIELMCKILEAEGYSIEPPPIKLVPWEQADMSVVYSMTTDVVDSIDEDYQEFSSACNALIKAAVRAVYNNKEINDKVKLRLEPPF